MTIINSMNVVTNNQVKYDPTKSITTGNFEPIQDFEQLKTHFKGFFSALNNLTQEDLSSPNIHSLNGYLNPSKTSLPIKYNEDKDLINANVFVRREIKIGTKYEMIEEPTPGKEGAPLGSIKAKFRTYKPLIDVNFDATATPAGKEVGTSTITTDWDLDTGRLKSFSQIV